MHNSEYLRLHVPFFNFQLRKQASNVHAVVSHVASIQGFVLDENPNDKDELLLKH